MHEWNAGLIVVTLAACHPEAVVIGGAMLDVQPGERPRFVGSYDFDLLAPVRGKGCLKRTSPTASTTIVYWMGTLPFGGAPPKDSLTLGAIAAASTDAIDKIAGADTILVTRVITEGQSPDEVCAYVYGRAVRLKKAAASPQKGSDGHDDDRENTEDGKSERDAPIQGK
jgi:hypothetical protein